MTRPRALPQFVKAVGIDGQPQYGEMQLFKLALGSGKDDALYAKDSRGNMYLLVPGYDKNAVEEIRGTLAGGGYSWAFNPSRAAVSPGAEHPSPQRVTLPLAPARSDTSTFLPATTLLAPAVDGALRNNWLFEILGNPNQYVYKLWKGPHDYRVRVIVDHFVTAEQPASISLKSRLASVDGFGRWLGKLRAGRAAAGGDLKVVVNPLNFTARHESSAIATSVSTKLQFGYDVSTASRTRQQAYIDGGEPVMDLISIDTKAMLSSTGCAAI